MTLPSLLLPIASYFNLLSQTDILAGSFSSAITFDGASYVNF